MAYFDGSFVLNIPVKAEHRQELVEFTKEISPPCHWVISVDGLKIEWDGCTPFIKYVSWLMWTCFFLAKREYKVTGCIQVEDEDGRSKGTLDIRDNGMIINQLILDEIPSIGEWNLRYSHDQAMEECLIVIRTPVYIKEMTGGSQMYARDLYSNEPAGIRGIAYVEAGARHTLNVGRIREVTGGDRMFARSLDPNDASIGDMTPSLPSQRGEVRTDADPPCV